MARWGFSGGLLRRIAAAMLPPPFLGAAASCRTYYTIQAVPREYTGSRVAAKERALGQIPAVVLTQGGCRDGGARKQLLTADKKQIHSLLRRVPFFYSTTFVLQVRAGSGSSTLIQSANVLPIKVHKDAETGEILNLVLVWAEKGSELTVDVPVVFKGENVCLGLQKGGYLHKIRTSLKYLCPSENIPQKIELDLAKLDIGDKISMHDVEVHPLLKLLSKNDTMPICKILATRPEASKTATIPKPPEESEATKA